MSLRLCSVAAMSIIGIAGLAKADTMGPSELFDPMRLVEIRIEMADDDWDTLRRQQRDFQSAFAGPLIRPYTYFRGTVWIDGQRIPSVGIRKKGFFGSQDTFRPSLKIRFDKYVEQEPVSQLKRLTLNNNKQDPTQLSQYLTYKLFNTAGITAPRCGFAKVTVNGQYLGVYSNVESIDKRFLRHRIGDDSINLYEGTITDFYPKSLERLEVKTNRVNHDNRVVKRLAEILSGNGPLDMDQLEEVVDVDHFLKFWAMESLIRFWDGYTNNQNNYFVYEHPRNRKLFFIPWGADSAFTNRNPMARFGANTNTSAIYARSILANRLYQTEGMPERYRQTMWDLLEHVWKDAELLDEVTRVERMVARHLHQQQANSRFATNAMREFIDTRPIRLLFELEEWPATVPAEPRLPSYTIDVGKLTATFNTRWHEREIESPTNTGGASLTLQLDGEQVPLRELGSVAQLGTAFRFGRRGRGTPPPRPATVVLAGKRASDGQQVLVTIPVEYTTFASSAGKTIEVRGSLTVGQARFGGFRGGFNRGGRSLIGQLELKRVGVGDGDIVSGTLQARVVETRGGLFGGPRRR